MLEVILPSDLNFGFPPRARTRHIGACRHAGDWRCQQSCQRAGRQTSTAARHTHASVAWPFLCLSRRSGGLAGRDRGRGWPGGGSAPHCITAFVVTMPPRSTARPAHMSCAHAALRPAPRPCRAEPRSDERRSLPALRRGAALHCAHRLHSAGAPSMRCVHSAPTHSHLNSDCRRRRGQQHNHEKKGASAGPGPGRTNRALGRLDGNTPGPVRPWQQRSTTFINK